MARAAVPREIPLTVVDEKNEPERGALTKITRVKMIAQNATAPGGSAIAMRVLFALTVELHVSEVLARDGMEGKPGADGGEDSALEGAPGNPGSMACSADTVSVGQVAITACDDGDSSGGRGGAEAQPRTRQADLDHSAAAVSSSRASRWRRILAAEWRGADLRERFHSHGPILLNVKSEDGGPVPHAVGAAFCGSLADARALEPNGWLP